MGRDWDSRRRREIQLYADAVGIVEEDLLAAGARDHLLAEFHLLGLELAANAGNVARGEGDVVETTGILEFLLGAAHDDAFARLAVAQQMHGRDAAGIEPVAGEAERRAVAVLEPQHFAVELPGLLEIGRLD